MVDADPSITDRLNSLFKSTEDGTASIRGAARGLGVSRDTVRRMMAGEHSPKGLQALQAAERSESRKPAWVGGNDTGKSLGVLFSADQRPQDLPGSRDVAAQLEYIAARNAKGQVDRAATARALGVSVRTIGRWLTGKARPQQANQEEIRREVRATRLANTDQAIDRGHQTTRVAVRFLSKVSADVRARFLNRTFTPEAMREAQLAWINSGDEGLADFLARDIELNYFYASGVDGEVSEILDTSS